MTTLLSKIYNRLKSINAVPVRQKTYEDWLAKGYNPEPLVSFIIQSHNKSLQTIKIIEKLRVCENAEIIVLDDGSEIQHSIDLRNELTNANEFLIILNDLYEVISYDRGIYFSRGKYIALLQDDDDFDGLRWVDEAIKLFIKFPEMAILGGRNGINYLDYEKTDDGIAGQYVFENNIGKRDNLFKFEVRSPDNDFQFIQSVNRAPMWIRRDHFLSILKHIDFAYAPIMHDDAELCLRTWLHGLRVGLYDAGFNSGKLGKGGMRIWNRTLTEEQSLKNSKKINQAYEDKFDIIREKVRQANLSI